MDIVLVRLTRGSAADAAAPASEPAHAAVPALNPETVVDVLWAVAKPGDQLEHIRARSGPGPDAVDLAMFHLGVGPVSSRDLALRLSRRAVATAPSLSGWVAAALSPV